MRKIPYITGYVGGLLLSVTALVGCAERKLSERPADGVLKIDLVWPDGKSVAGGRLWLYGEDGSLHRAINCAAAGHACRVPAGGTRYSRRMPTAPTQTVKNRSHGRSTV